jgi:mRNA interferase RelE/StbE
VNEESYAVAWTSPGKRALRNMPEKAANAAVEFIYGSLSESPHRAGKPLQFELADLHSARRGDYRIIYRISEEQRTIEVVTLEHRSDAYRSR